MMHIHCESKKLCQFFDPQCSYSDAQFIYKMCLERSCNQMIFYRRKKISRNVANDFGTTAVSLSIV